MMEVYTLDEVAAKLQVTRRTLYAYLRDGQLKGIKIGREWRISETNLNEFLQHGTADSNSSSETESEFTEREINARRLSRVLNDYGQDPKVLQALAHYLNYVPDQLKKDIADLYENVRLDD